MSTTPTTGSSLDLDRLTPLLCAQLPQLHPPLAAELIAGGRSNLTYAVRDAAGSAVIVRRPPVGHLLATAHDMRREYTVIHALQATAVPVPRTHLLCPDDAVIGAPFFVMDLVPGVPYRSREQLAAIGTARTAAVCNRMIDVLADLHAVGWTAVGLASFGRPDGFLRRQVTRWKKQFDASRTRELAGVDRLYEALWHQVPDTARHGIVHGDFRLDNLLVDANDRVTAVLDWEMATIGDPHLDLAVLMAYSTAAVELGERPNANNAPLAAGYPSAREILARYQSASRHPVPAMDFHIGLANFKIAAILEGVHYRFINGATIGEGFDQVAARVPPLIKAGLAALGEKS